MKGNFLYSEENDDFYRVSQNILPPIEAYTFFPTGNDVSVFHNLKESFILPKSESRMGGTPLNSQISGGNNNGDKDIRILNYSEEPMGKNIQDLVLNTDRVEFVPVNMRKKVSENEIEITNLLYPEAEVLEGEIENDLSSRIKDLENYRDNGIHNKSISNLNKGEIVHIPIEQEVGNPMSLIDGSRRLILCPEDNKSKYVLNNTCTWTKSKAPHIQIDLTQTSPALTFPHTSHYGLKRTIQKLQCDDDAYHKLPPQINIISPPNIPGIRSSPQLLHKNIKDIGGGELRDEMIVMEGEIYKYKPGLVAHYISRWGVVTHSAFRYYKSRWSAHTWLSKPLGIIPFHRLKSTRRIPPIPCNTKRKNSNKLGKQNSRAYESNLFELYLMCEGLEGEGMCGDVNSLLNSYLAGDRLREGRTDLTDLVDISNLDNLPNLTDLTDQTDLTGLAPKSTGNALKERGDGSNYSLPILNINLCNLNLPSSEKGLYQITGKMSNTSGINSTKSKHHSPSVKEGHLMRSPGSHRLDSYRSNNQNKPREEREEEKGFWVDGIHFRSTTEQQLYYEYIIQNSKWLNTFAKTNPRRNPLATTQILPTKATWSNREVEWYNAETKYIFSGKNNQETQKWVSVLNWLTCTYKFNSNE